MKFDFTQEPPRAAAGIPAARLTLSGGRTAVDLAPHGGLTSIRYFGSAGLGGRELFHGDALSAWVQCFRPYIHLGGAQQYFPEFNNSAFYPFGYDSNCAFEGKHFRHRLTVLNDALVFELESDDCAEFSLMLGVTGVCVPVQRPGRVWSRFAAAPDGRASLALCRDGESAETWIAVGGDGELACRATGHDIQKEYFRIAGRNGTAALAVVFGPDRDATRKRLDELAPQLGALAAAERETFRRSVEHGTRLTGADRTLESFVREFPEILRSLAVKDIPGAVCASNTGYWVWGWDSMVHSDSLMQSGMTGEVYNRLRYYRDTADPVNGIFHAIDTSGKVTSRMEPAAQTIYAVMLYNAWLYARDAAALREFYPFAVRLLDRAAADRVGDTGLCRGISLYPDFPADLEQDGNDISSFNNSILFQAARGLAEVARQLGENADAARFEHFADGVKTGFRRYLYDPEEHYFYDSISAKTLEPRRYYPLYAILHLTGFADELVEGVEDDVARYMWETFTESAGPAMFGRRSAVFYSDGNQLGMYSTVIEGFYRRMLRRLNVPDTLLPTIVSDWSHLELSEANTAEAVNMRLTTDHPGKKQMYAAVSYYSLIVGVFCGINLTPEAVRFSAPTRAEDGWRLENLPVAGAKLTIAYLGHGRKIARVNFDGETLPAAELPVARLKPGTTHAITVELQAN